ncbi:long-chain-fatty-acid--CoA ligase [Amycolatopsis pigmentata]|uniref:Long-chain fatty acid--CoA ligase n=1 Tax=Amycolatopsis pigmentata TaxID=450801 RepID=A0ABW5FQV2_9PSEU
MKTYNLSSLLEATSQEHPDRIAIVSGATRLSFGQLDATANQVANLLRSLGVEPGDKVALMCPNVPQFTVIYYGILKAGATVVPLNVLLKAREIAYHLSDSDAKAIFAFHGTAQLPIGAEARGGVATAGTSTHLVLIGSGTADSCEHMISEQSTSFEPVATNEDDTAVVLYTSGTTGQPKGAELRHRNMRDNVWFGGEVFRSDPDRPDTYLCALPLFHSFGQSVVQNSAIAYGGTLVMLPRFEPPAALELMLTESVTHLAGVPTMFWGLLGALDEDTDVDRLAQNLRVAISGGSALPLEIHKEFEQRFGVTILEGYGLSETSPVASFSTFGAPPRPGSVGVPIPGVEMALTHPTSWDPIDWAPDAIGEIAIRGHNVFKGYLNRPGATDEVLSPDGWFRTGDLGRRDADGWYYIVDRAKDMIIRGGFNVYPREIEEVLLTHPDVSLAAVIGVPHHSHGEEIKAIVVLTPGSTASADDIIRWSQGQMASYKYPREVDIVESLPMTATGKILKRELT